MRRALAWLARGLVGLAAALALLHLPPVREGVRGLLVRLAARATGGEASLGRLDYRIWGPAGVVRVEGLELRLATLQLAVDRAEVSWSPGRGLLVTADGPRVVVVIGSEPEPNHPAVEGRPWRALSALAGAEIAGGRLELRTPEGETWLALESIEGRLSRDSDRHRARLTATLAAGWPGAGLRVPAIAVTAQAEMERDGRLRLPSLRLRSGGTTADVEATLDRVSPLTASARGTLDLDSAVLNQLLPALQAQGHVLVRTQIEVDAGQARGPVAADASALFVMGLGPWSGGAKGRIQGRRLPIESLDVAGYRGRLTGDGELYLWDGRSRLSLEAHELDVRGLAASLSGKDRPLSSRADGRLALALDDWDVTTLAGDGDVRLSSRGEPGLPLEGPFRLALVGERLDFATAQMRAREIRVTGEGRLGFDGALGLRYAARIPDLSAVGPILADLGASLPPLALAGSLTAEGAVEGTLPEVVTTVGARAEAVRIEGMAFTGEAALRLSGDRLEIDKLSLSGPQGTLEAHGQVPLLEGRAWNVRARADGLDLSDALARRGLKLRARAGGGLTLKGAVLDDPDWDASIEAHAVPLTSGTAADEDEPELRLRATAAKSGRKVRLENLEGELGGGTLAASGQYTLDAHTLDGRIDALGVQIERLPLVPELAPGLSGTLTATAAWGGRLAAPEGALDAALRSVAQGGQGLPDLTLEARSDGKTVVGTGAAVRGGESRPLLDARLQLQEPYSLHAEVDLASLPAQELLDSLPALKGAGASLSVVGRAVLDTSLRKPDDLRYRVRSERLEATVRGRSMRAEPFAIEGDGRSLRIEGLRLQGKATRLTAGGSLGIAGDVPSTLEVRGETDLGLVASVLADTELSGNASFGLRIKTLFPAPLLDGELRVEAGPGRRGDLRWDALDVSAVARDGVLEVQRFAWRLLGGAVEAQGSLPLAAGKAQRLALTARGLDLAALVAPQPGKPQSLVVDVLGTVLADAPRLDAVRAEGSVVRFAVRSGPEAMDIEAPAPWRYEAGRLRLEPIRLRGSSGQLDIEAAASGLGTAPRVEVGLAGQAELALINPLLGGSASLSGAARVDLRGTADAQGFSLSGEAAVAGARAVLREPPLAVSKLAGTMVFRGRTAELRDWTGEVGDGRLAASGSVDFAPSGSAATDLRLRAERVPLTYPEGLQSRLSGEVHLRGAGDRYKLEGDVKVQRALFNRDFDNASQSLDTLALELGALDHQGSFLDRVLLGVRVDLAEPLRVQNAAAELLLDGGATLGGTLAEPSVSGAVSVREGGTFLFGRTRLRIREGRVQLAGYPAQSPELNVTGLAKVSGVGIEVRLRGRLDDMQTSLSSPNRSDLTQGDLATLLATGRTAQAAASEGGAIVAEELAAALGGALNQKIQGKSPVFIDVSSDQSILTDDTDPTQRINVGVPIGQKLYVIHSTALDGTERRWILDLHPGGQFRLRAIAEEDNSQTFEVLHRFGFRLFSPQGSSRAKGDDRPRVREVRVAGGGPLPEADLEERAHLDRGDRYDYFVAEKAAMGIREALVKRGHLAARVEHTSAAAGDGFVDVAFSVDAGPRVAIEWGGDDPGRSERKRVAAGWGGEQPLEATAARLAREATWRLMAGGHTQASVSAEVSQDDAVARVRFDVRRGPLARSVGVRFEGNQAVSSRELAAALPGTNKPELFALLTEERQRLEGLLRLRYAKAGFVRARVGTPRAEWDPAALTLTVTLPVEEGPRALVLSLALPEEASNASGPGAPKLQLKAGEPFRIDAYLADRGALATWYRSQGYPEARLSSLLEPHEGDLRVTFAVDPGERPRVGQVRLARAGRTRQKTVDDAVTLEPGDLIRPRDLAATRDHLSESRAFRSVDVRTERSPQGGEVRDVVVDLVQRPDVEIEYGLRYTTEGSGEPGSAPSSPSGGRIQFTGGIELPNPLGRANRFRFLTVLNSERVLNAFTFDSPTFFSRRWPTQAFVYDDEDLDTEIQGLTKRVQGIAVQQTQRWREDLSGRRWHDRLRLQYGYTFKWINYKAIETGAILAGNRGYASVSLIGDARDSLTDPRRGLFWSLSADLAAKALGSDVNYVKLFGQAFKFVPLGGKLVWAQALRLGVTPGDDPLLLLENRFKAGGATTVRGIEQNGLGPQTAQGDALGGQALFVFNQELRFPIWKKLQGGVFYDAGNVWPLARGLDLGDLRHSVGVGLRLMFPFGPVRLDWARLLDPRDGEMRSRFVFSLGHSF